MNKETLAISQFLGNLNEIRDPWGVKGVENPTLEFISGETFISMEFKKDSKVELKLFDINQEDSDLHLVQVIEMPITKM